MSLLRPLVVSVDRHGLFADALEMVDDALDRRDGVVEPFDDDAHASKEIALDPAGNLNARGQIEHAQHHRLHGLNAVRDALSACSEERRLKDRSWFALLDRRSPSRPRMALHSPMDRQSMPSKNATIPEGNRINFVARVRRCLPVISLMFALACGDDVTNATVGGGDIGGSGEGGSVTNVGGSPDGGGGAAVGGSGGDVEIGGGGGDGGDGGGEGGHGGSPIVCACVAESLQPCQTACGTTGQQQCSSDCLSWSSCVPPVEVCNGVDEDCDGIQDGGLPANVTQLSGAPYSNFGQPHIASNGVTYAIVYNAPAVGLMFQLFDASGSVASPAIGVTADLSAADDAEIAWNGSRWGVAWSTDSGSFFRAFNDDGTAATVGMLFDTENGNVDAVSIGSSFVVMSSAKIVKLSQAGVIQDSVTFSGSSIARTGSSFVVFSGGSVTPLTSSLDVGTSQPLGIAAIGETIESGNAAIVSGSTASGVVLFQVDAAGNAGASWTGGGGGISIAPGYVRHGTKLRRLYGPTLAEVAAFDVGASGSRIASTASSVMGVGEGSAYVTGDLVCDAP